MSHSPPDFQVAVTKGFKNIAGDSERTGCGHPAHRRHRVVEPAIVRFVLD